MAAVMKQIKVQISNEKQVRILVIDDNKDFRQNIKEYLEENANCSITLASTLDAGYKYLNDKDFDMIIADVDFKSTLKGDKFIIDNKDIIGQSKVVVATAQGLNIVDNYKELIELGYKVLEKSNADFTDQINETAIEAANMRRESIENAFKHTSETMIGNPSVVSVSFVPESTILEEKDEDTITSPVTKYLTQELNDTLILWLKGRSNPDKPIFAIGSKVFTANELALQVQQGTEIGMALMKSFVQEFKNSLDPVTEES